MWRELSGTLPITQEGQLWTNSTDRMHDWQQQQHVEDAHLVYLNNHMLPDVAENWIILRKSLQTLLSTYYTFPTWVLVVTIGVSPDTSTGPQSWQCQRTRGKLIRGWLTWTAPEPHCHSQQYWPGGSSHRHHCHCQGLSCHWPRHHQPRSKVPRQSMSRHLGRRERRL